MPRNHHSRSGPVTVRKVADPIPPSPEELRARLLHKLALIEDRIASREAWNRRNPGSAHRLKNLLRQRAETLLQLQGASKVPVSQSPAGPSTH